MNELVYLSIINSEGVKMYMDSSTDEKREKLFHELTCRNSRYYRHGLGQDVSEWKEVDAKEEGGFFKGTVLSEAEINFSLKVRYVCDIYTLMEVAAKVTMIILTVIFVIEATEIVLINLVSLAGYIELYGIRGGIDTYMAIGTYNVENGLVGVLKVESEASKYTAPNGGGGVTSTIRVNNQIVNFGHGGRHLEGTGLNIDTVNRALANEVSTINLGIGQFHKGQIVVDGITIEYTSYGVSERVINVGTYYPLQ